ncbi:2-nitropropane dioxygenase [Tepiditoga spiralis]|uniref:2-nitropropane dioxygenase n=1 Tax=Tepiditoga spiralis TaxID=2108365 RepID=A0A7G1G3E1_9BACT|nr:nitronate monooxygenase [Tepiditoga spiralis]BBE30525.1 2-nitropropane dioxygenase [Tepiditoga spiralis]
MKTRITELLDIEYPIIEGGMAWVGTGTLAAAVSNAGGLGTIGSGSMTPEILKQHIDIVKSQTNKPFAVNIMLLNPYVEELIKLVLSEKVPVVIFGAGNPGKYIKKLKENGIKVMAVVASENLAIRLERNGVDAIIGEGMECGGHIGDVSTLVLISKLAKMLKVPLIAAGGIADSTTAAATFMLGAEGIQMGTRFIATPECEAHQTYKDLVVKSGIRDAVVTGSKIGHPARVIKTKFAKKIKELEMASPEEAEKMMVGSLRKAFIEGNKEEGSFMAGQSCGLIESIKPVKNIIIELNKGLEEKLEVK